MGVSIPLESKLYKNIRICILPWLDEMQLLVAVCAPKIFGSCYTSAMVITCNNSLHACMEESKRRILIQYNYRSRVGAILFNPVSQ